MDCKTFRNQVVDLFDKEVSPRTKAEYQQHMDECEACRNYYHELAQAAEMLRPRHSPLQNQQKPATFRHRIKAAAIFAGVILAAGITVAAIHHAQNRPAQPPQAKATPVSFTNISLDSILSVVAPYYKKTVVFRDEAPRQLQLIMTWNPATPFDDFVRRLNAFDGLLLTVQHDTLFVEANSADEK
ncbi:MAG: zf-HC2 domain-containing protein [Bacteroidaceae bacterium]|nr:zf-HC2 domain-containing protein [Bacteroidaceae bacterium]